MATDQVTGMIERVIYGGIIAATARLVEKGYITSDMQVYLAGGGVAGLGAAYAWWLNRPGRLLDAAAAQIPGNAKLVIAVPVHAPVQDKEAAEALANSAGDKVIAKATV